MSYWTNRQEQLKKTAEKDEAAIKKRLSKFCDAEFKRLDKEIAAYYQKYGENNVIEYRQMMESLSDEDRRLLMQQMDEFATKYPQYADLMPVRETIYKLDRLQGLQYSVYMAQANIAGYTNEQIKEYETSLAQKGLNYAMETMGFGSNFYSINSDVVRQFVDVAWSNGENFSTRIWNDTKKLAQYLNQDIAQGFARGDSYDRLVRNLQSRFSRVNRSNAYRLVYTEGTYVMAESTMQPFKEDFEQYRLSPVLDGRTCQICRGLREQVFLISERQPGVNFPPIHPWCRCSWEIVVDDWDKWIDYYAEKHGGDKKQAGKIANRMTDDADDGIIKKTEWDNGLSPRGQLSEDIIEQLNGYAEADEEAYYRFIADELGISVDKAKEYTDSVMAYTDAGSDIYSEVRRYQRQEPLQFMSEEDVSKLSNDIEEYIKNAPRWNGGTTYRGVTVSDDELTKYQKGYRVTMGGTSSWTGTKQIAIDFSSRNASSERPNEIIYHCETQNKGTGIKHMSVFQEEDEILCSKDSIYIVDRVERDDNYIYYVYLKEV